MSSNDSVQKTIKVALLLCLVCSIVVSGAAVLLKPVQQANKALDRKTNILAAAGIETKGQDIDALFHQFTPKVVDLDSGVYTTEINAETYDQRKAAKDPKLSDALSDDQDIASINRRERFATVYLLEKEGQLERVIIPVHGYGLWSTLYGFLALEGDANTVAGLGFYSHAETPGLGGEVDNPRWKAKWVGKQVLGQQGQVQIELVKSVDPNDPEAKHKVDALSGATLTSNGVENLLHFWLGEKGFGPYLANLRAGDV
ncbi:MAG: Na(+)-translocating NADH-quinone reductase subunit C [Pseudomonadales bacterium]|nr:Na(+)-translocating NADH-quinone reductase subunit C [Pseudomonadales bacterium]